MSVSGHWTTRHFHFYFKTVLSTIVHQIFGIVDDVSLTVYATIKGNILAMKKIRSLVTVSLPQCTVVHHHLE